MVALLDQFGVSQFTATLALASDVTSASGMSGTILAPSSIVTRHASVTCDHVGGAGEISFGAGVTLMEGSGAAGCNYRLSYRNFNGTGATITIPAGVSACHLTTGATAYSWTVSYKVEYYATVASPAPFAFTGQSANIFGLNTVYAVNKF